MKITAVEAEVRRIPFAGEVRPAWAPGTVWREKVTTVYRVETDEGITGYGAGQGTPGVVRERITPRLIGQDPFRVEHLFRAAVNWGGGFAGLPIACAIEMALWDIVGKAAGLPLYRLWGMDKDRVRAYASLVEQRAPEQRAEDALRLLDLGYRALKLRLHAPTMKEDVAQVEAVRAAVGVGLSGLRKVAAYADLRGKPVAPHHGGSGIGVAAHLHLSASCANAPWVELLQEPPYLPVETFQGLLTEPLIPNAEGFVRLPDAPGLGIELNTSWERIA